MRLEGQTAIVTGGGRGIGRAICLALAREGANVVIAARTWREIQETERLVERVGSSSRALAIRTDVRDEAGVQHLIEKAIEGFGRLDILVNNAGVAYRKFLADTSPEEYDKIMDTNVKGIFLCTKYALPHLLKRGNGRIINIASVEGKHGVPKLSVYGASKFAVIGLTEALAYEVGGGLQVYAVCPAGVDTEMYSSMFMVEPALKPNNVAKQVTELCLPGTGIPSGSTIEVCKSPVRLV
ncbi:SDR family NAD(P)-dependent oxidoreductase [Methanosarcina sp. Mfa9]|uniref:SDR family NAD(P)-dependent oxidoreductase n=1 Tax=Methanosarcina sp. Mfa9 TaxID=3439063 RepID=UPI003F87CE6E